MAIWMDDGERDGTQVSGGCDGTADVPNLPAFAQKNHIKRGSKFFCIDEEAVYIMRSDGTFKKLGG